MLKVVRLQAFKSKPGQLLLILDSLMLALYYKNDERAQYFVHDHALIVDLCQFLHVSFTTDIDTQVIDTLIELILCFLCEISLNPLILSVVFEVAHAL